jgi:hypothetical protein
LPRTKYALVATGITPRRGENLIATSQQRRASYYWSGFGSSHPARMPCARSGHSTMSSLRRKRPGRSVSVPAGGCFAHQSAMDAIIVQAADERHCELVEVLRHLFRSARGGVPWAGEDSEALRRTPMILAALIGLKDAERCHLSRRRVTYGSVETYQTYSDARK